jgi:phage terminase small subunit
MAKLTAKQQAFVDAYLGEAKGVATQAARLAGYKGSDNVLAKQGHDNLRNPKISTLIAERLATSPLALSRARVLALLSACAQGAGGDEKASDRIKALELLGKYHRIFADRVEHTGKDGKPIEHQHNQGPDLSKLSTEQLREYRGHMQAAAGVLQAKEDEA